VTSILKGQFVRWWGWSNQTGKFGISYQMTSQSLLKLGNF